MASPLHRESFGVVGGEWGKVGALSWSFDPMVSIGNGPVSHEVLNNLVCVAGDSGNICLMTAALLKS